jgi:2-octaprenyl-6-methoxyphenol hydroxylase
MPLQVMRIVDAGGEVPEPRVAHDFNAADISDKPFGWNLPNWLLRREMVAHLAETLPWPISGPASAPRSC